MGTLVKWAPNSRNGASWHSRSPRACSPHTDPGVTTVLSQQTLVFGCWTLYCTESPSVSFWFSYVCRSVGCTPSDGVAGTRVLCIRSEHAVIFQGDCAENCGCPTPWLTLVSARWALVSCCGVINHLYFIHLWHLTNRN